MIVFVTMKDPDVLEDGLHDAYTSEVQGLMADLQLTKEEAEVVADHRLAKARKACAKWFEWGEYLTVRIDTDLDTITVVKADEA